MARPSGWDILGLDGDPTPGVVESVQALAKAFGDFAHDVESAYRSLNSFGSDTTALQWVGQTADAFKGQFGPLPGRLQKLYTSYSEASDALTAYAPQLQAAQSKADAALRQAQDVNADLQRATANANNAASDLKTAQQNHAVSPNPQAVTDAQTAHDTAQTNLNNAKTHMAALTTQANQAHDDRIAAAKTCASAIHHAQSDGIHNKHWWEHIGADLAEWGGKIAEIANDLAPFLDVLALATSWIPGVDVITAGLAEADNLIALAGTGLQIVGDGMQGHWGDALLSAGMLAGTYLGGKALEKVGGNLLGRLGNKGCTRAGDPVDVVSGRMISEEVDLELAGVLPVVLGRAYNSGYETGRLFGPGWASTIDQRIAINAAGIHFVGDDAETLTYAEPGIDGYPVLPVEGPRWPLTWDREADEIRITDPETGWVRHFPTIHFCDDSGQIRDLTGLSDRNGNRITVVRAEDGTPIAIEHARYRVAIDTVAYSDGLRVSALRLLDGTDRGVQVKEYEYDDRGRLTGVVDSSGLPFRYQYDEADRIVAWVDRVGYRYSYHYDADGRVVRGIGDGGYLSATFEYGPGNQTTVVDSLGHATCYRYDTNGRVASITDPMGNIIHTEYDVDGRLLSSVDATGHRTMHELDPRGNRTRTQYADGRVIEFEYGDLDLLTSIRTPDGATWHQRYDDRGNLTTVADPTGAVTSYEYLANGSLCAFTDATGNTTRFDTDAAGLPVAVTDALGARTETVRDVFGRAVTMTDPLGAVSRNGWTIEGLQTWHEGPDSARTEWSYDPDGRPIAERDSQGGVTTFEIGPFGQTIARTDAGGSRHQFSFDTELNLVSVTNAAGAVWAYTHDAAGQLVSETDFIGRTLSYRYDHAGHLVERVNGVGQRIVLTRDVMGRVVTRQTPQGDYSYSYDATGRALAATGPGTSVSYARDEVGRVIRETVDERTVTYDYDLAGRRIRRATPAGSVTTWSYDAAGRAGGLDLGIGTLAFEFDAAGRISGTSLADARIAVSRDVAGRPVGLALWAGTEPQGAPTMQRNWTYQRDNVPAEETDSLRGTRRFQTDQLGRVTSTVADAWSESFAYDSFGNLARAETPDADTSGTRETDRTLTRVAGRTSYEHDAAGRLVRTVRRTLDGRRRVWQYEWDAEDHLVQVSTPDAAVWRYTYDPVGRRTSKFRVTASGETAENVLFTWDGMRVAEQHVHGPDGSAQSLTWEYEPDSFRPVAQIRRNWAAGADQRLIDEAYHAIVTDLVGTPTELVGEDGAVAWFISTGVWGRTISVSGDRGVDCPLRFPGQYLDDETGLHYNLHRYYDPDTAAYLSPDPLGLVAAPNDHGYVPNPFTWIDPFGLYGAGGGTMCGAADMALRAKNLQKDVGWSGTTSVVRVRKLAANADGTCDEQVWVASNKTYMPTGWRNKGSLRPDEIFVKGEGHAEETIINNLFNKNSGVQEWGIVEGGTSTGICWGNCFPDLTGNGLKVGGPSFRASKNNSPWRMFWSP